AAGARPGDRGAGLGHPDHPLPQPGVALAVPLARGLLLPPRPLARTVRLELAAVAGQAFEHEIPGSRGALAELEILQHVDQLAERAAAGFAAARIVAGGGDADREAVVDEH